MHKQTSVFCDLHLKSDHQKQFQEKLEEAGGKYILAYSLDDIFPVISSRALALPLWSSTRSYETRPQR
jgi:hypothetical protein